MHQYLFHIGDFPIRMYGLMLTLAIFLATGTAYFLARQDGRWHEHVLDIGIYGGFAGLIGARLWDVFFFDWSYYQDHLLEIPFVWQGGMAVQGGMLGGLVTGIVYCLPGHDPGAGCGAHGQPAERGCFRRTYRR